VNATAALDQTRLEAPACSEFRRRWDAAIRCFAALGGPASLAVALEAEAADCDLSVLQRVRGAFVDHFVPLGWVPFHAAAVEVDRGLALVPGPSGSGKSTFAARCAALGCLAADELVLLACGERGVEALVPPLPISLGASDAAGLEGQRGWTRCGECGLEAKDMLMPDRVLAGRFDVQAVVLLERGGAAPARPTRTHPGAALGRLVGSMARFGSCAGPATELRRRAWRVVTALVDTVASYRLHGDNRSFDARDLGHLAGPGEGGADDIRPCVR
jgi:hypothetical protein